MKFFNDPSQAMRVNEDLWFLVNQELLLAIANTEFGRDLLCIPREYPKVVKITKCSVHCLLKDNGETATVLADFRVGAKWANVIRYRWGQFVSYSRYFDFRSPYLIRSLTGVSRFTSEKMAVSLSTLTAYPDPDPETTTVDGWAGYYSSSESWTTVRQKTTGNQALPSGTTLQIEHCNEGDVNFHVVKRASALFDTSSLTSSASVSASVCSFYGDTKQTGFTDDYRLCTSNPDSNTNITTSDYVYTKYGTSALASDISDSSWSNSAYNDYTMTDLTVISKTSISKLGLRYTKDATATDPTGSGVAFMSCKSADNSGTSNDPKLVVTYTISSGLLGIERTPIRGVMRGAMRP